MARADFIYDVPSRNADLYYATRFMAHDACIFFKRLGRKYLVMTDLEIDRAKREACVDRVLSVNPYSERARRKKRDPNIVDVLDEIFKDMKIRELTMPGSSSFTLVKGLKERGYRVEPGDVPFYPERFVKGPVERAYMSRSQGTVFAAMRLARDVLANCRIRGNRLVYRGRALTSEMLRTMIDVFLLERGYVADGTIVSCGHHAIDPHDVGAGPLKPHSSIIVDIFPKSSKTCYFGDATRTFCRGSAPEALRRMYAAVKKGQELGFSMVRAGINGRRIHEAITVFFEKEGYPTCGRNGRMVGFFHGTGHSIGLEVHEEPLRMNWNNHRIPLGAVMSVEPGLYYPDVGGVRIEDLVHVTKTGCDILSGFPKRLEIL